MENENIVKFFNRAIQDVINKDSHLLVNDLSERSISSRLAFYLQHRFKDYNVDCEYNGDVDSNTQKKKIDVLKSQLESCNKELTEKEKKNPDELLTKRAVFPDIIIHKRGENGENNLCIIEVKKTSSSRTKCAFDDVKLKIYTAHYFHLKYQLGIYIEFGVGEKYEQNIIQFYKEGGKVDEDAI